MTDAELLKLLWKGVADVEQQQEAADRIEALTAERDEAVNQQDSARHSVDVLAKRGRALIAENAKLHDRIEALTKERDQHWDSFVHWRKEADAMTEQLAAAQQDAKEAEAYAEELEKQCEGLMQAAMNNGQALILAEAKLAKAVDLALEECPFRHGTPRYNDWWHHRRATLAEIKGEIKGESHE